MSKRRKVAEIENKSDLLKKLADNDDETIEFRSFKNFFPDEGFQTIWVKPDARSDSQEVKGFLKCNNPACAHKKTRDKVSY